MRLFTIAVMYFGCPKPPVVGCCCAVNFGYLILPGNKGAPKKQGVLYIITILTLSTYFTKIY